MISALGIDPGRITGKLEVISSRPIFGIASGLVEIRELVCLRGVSAFFACNSWLRGVRLVRPAVTHIHGFGPEDVAEEFAVGLGVLAVGNYMRTRNLVVAPQKQLKNSSTGIEILRVIVPEWMPGAAEFGLRQFNGRPAAWDCR